MITVVVTPKCGDSDVYRDINLSCIRVGGNGYFALGEVEYNMHELSSINFYQTNLTDDQWNECLRIKHLIHENKICQVNGYNYEYQKPIKLDFSKAIKEDV